MPTTVIDVNRAHNKLLNAIEELRAVVGSDRRLRLQTVEMLLSFAKTELMLMKDISHDRMLYAARAVEGLSACVFGTGPASDQERVKVLRECGARLLHAGEGLQERFEIIAPSETSRLATAVRDTVLRALQRHAKHQDLAKAVEVGSQVHRAQVLFPDKLTEEERCQRFDRAIRLLTRGRSETDQEFAARVVVACVKAAGFRRPSGLFQFEEKALKRTIRKKRPTE